MDMQIFIAGSLLVVGTLIWALTRDWHNHDQHGGDKKSG